MLQTPKGHTSRQVKDSHTTKPSAALKLPRPTDSNRQPSWESQGDPKLPLSLDEMACMENGLHQTTKKAWLVH